MRPTAVTSARWAGKGENLRGRTRESVAPIYPLTGDLLSDGTDHQAAMKSLRAPAGRDVVERVTAERLGQPHLRAVEANETDDVARIAELESQLTEQRAARKKAEAAANEMAVLVARVRTQLAEEKEAREDAEATVGQMAALIAQEHERVRKAEEELRLAWAQVPMVEQRELSPGKTTFAERAKRALGGGR
jgi:seryl-tRNA synthetase